MKSLLFLIVCILGYSTVFAQSESSLDKEKLFDLYLSQKYAEAAAYLKSIYSETTNDPKQLSQLGYCYLMSGNNTEAEKFYTKIYDLQPQNLAVLFSLANINNKRGNTEKAKIYYGEIVKIDSNNFNVYKQLANLFASKKDSLKQVYLIKANKINPIEADIAFDLAEVYTKFQKHEKAYEVLSIAIAADSENVILQKAKLPVAIALKKYNEVIISGEQIMKADKDPLVIKDLARAYYSTRNYQKAVGLYKILELMEMQNEGTLYYTALSYRALKNYPMATVYTKKTIDEAISSNTANYYALLGLIYEENDKLKLANFTYMKGLEFKALPTIYYRLAVLYDTKLKQEKTALKYYLLYLKSKPDLIIDKDEITFAKARVELMKTVN